MSVDGGLLMMMMLIWGL